MSNIADIRDVLLELIESNIPKTFITAKVLKCDTEFCDVLLPSGQTIKDVPILANNDKTGHIIQPALNSTVILASLTGDLSNLIVFKNSVIKNLISAVEGKFTFKNKTTTLKDILNDIVSKVKASKTESKTIIVTPTTLTAGGTPVTGTITINIPELSLNSGSKSDLQGITDNKVNKLFAE